MYRHGMAPPTPLHAQSAFYAPVQLGREILKSVEIPHGAQRHCRLTNLRGVSLQTYIEEQNRVTQQHLPCVPSAERVHNTVSS